MEYLTDMSDVILTTTTDVIVLHNNMYNNCHDDAGIMLPLLLWGI